MLHQKFIKMTKVAALLCCIKRAVSLENGLYSIHAVLSEPILFARPSGRARENVSRITRHVALLRGRAFALKYWWDGSSEELFFSQRDSCRVGIWQSGNIMSGVRVAYTSVWYQYRTDRYQYRTDHITFCHINLKIGNVAYKSEHTRTCVHTHTYTNTDLK